MFGNRIFGARLFYIIQMLVSGVSARGEATQTMAAISMSLLAGPAIMMLTVIWGFIIAFGSDDLSGTRSSSNPDNANTSIPSKPFGLTGYGVRTGPKAKQSAIIMLLSMIPFLILGISKLLTSTTATRLAVLISLIITLVLLFSYCFSQAFGPWIVRTILEYALFNYIAKNLLDKLLSPDGIPDEHKIKEFFDEIDKDDDHIISLAELRAFICEIQKEDSLLHKEDIEKIIMEELDDSEDETVDEIEFISQLSTWLEKVNNDKNDQGQEDNSLFQGRAKKRTDKPWWNYSKAVFLIILGTAAAVLITNPLMETLIDFSNSVNIPPFLVSYVVIPFALNVKLALRTITSARYKEEINAACKAISQIYGAVFMNNVVGLVTFLAIVYIRDISLSMSAEVVVVLIICTAMGVFATFTTKIRFWTCIIVLLLYPISLLLLYVLTYGFIWP